MRESDILFEYGNYYVIAVKTGYEVYKRGTTAAQRVARIGWPKSAIGVNRAVEECKRRQHVDETTHA